MTPAPQVQDSRAAAEKLGTVVGAGVGLVAGAAGGAWVGVKVGGEVGAVVGGVLGAAGGFYAGAKAGGAAGAAIHSWLQKHRPADDGTGPVGPRSRAALRETHGSLAQEAHLLVAMPNPEGDGDGLPNVRSPAARISRRGLYMPAPDDAGGGTPWSNVYKPNPEDPRPGGPQ